MLSPSIEALTCGNSFRAWIAGAEDEGQVGQLDAVLLRGTRPCAGRAGCAIVRVVDLEDRRDVGRGPLGEDHVLGGDLADLRHRDDLVAIRSARATGAPGRAPAPRRADARPRRAPARGRGRRRRAAATLPVLDVGKDVVLRHAVVDAGALDLADVDRRAPGAILRTSGEERVPDPLLEGLDVSLRRRPRRTRRGAGGRRRARGRRRRSGCRLGGLRAGAARRSRRRRCGAGARAPGRGGGLGASAAGAGAGAAAFSAASPIDADDGVDGDGLRPPGP